MRAQKNLLLLFALVCALGVIAGSYLAGTWRAREELRQQGQRQLQLMAPDLQSLLQKYETLPFVLGFQPDLIEALAHPTDAPAITRLNSTLQTIQQQAKVGAIYVMDRDGLTIGASNWDQPLGFVGKNFSYRPYFDAALHGRAGRFYGIGTSTSEAGYFIAQPVYRNGTAGGPVTGVVAVKISLADFERTWRSSDDAIVLADSTGVIFLSNRPDWIYRSLHALDADTERQLAHTQQYTGQKIMPLSGHADLFVTQSVGQLGWQLMLFPGQSRVVRTGVQWAAAAALLLACAAVSSWALHQRPARHSGASQQQRSSSGPLHAGAHHARLAGEQHQLPAQLSHRLRDEQVGMAAQRHDLLAGVLLGVRQLPFGVRVQRVQAAVDPVRAVAEEDDAGAVGQHDGVVAAAPGAFEVGQADLHRHHAGDRAAGRAVAVHRLRDEVAGLAGAGADAVEAPRPAMQRGIEIRTIGKVLADEAQRLVPVAGAYGQAVAVHHVDGAHLGLLLDGLQRAVEAGDRRRIGRMRQRFDQVGLEAQYKRQRFIFLQQRLQVRRHQLQLALALLPQFFARAPGAGQVGPGNHAQRAHECEQQ